ncbi:MAG: hypothetical protein ACR2GY_07795 [Phycisphaerales bacterium]
MRWGVAVLVFWCMHAQAQRLPGFEIEDIETCTLLLEMDEQQASLALDLFLRHTARFESTVAPRARQHLERIGPPFEAGYRDRVRQHQQEHEAILREFAELDETFFADLASLLHEEQLPLMKRIRFARQRSICRPSSNQLPEGNVDLVPLLYAERTSQNKAAMDAFLDDFEPRYVSALQESSEASIKSHAAFHEYEAIRIRLEALAEGDLRRADLEAKMHDSLTDSGDVMLPGVESIVEMNRQALSHLKEVLDDSAWERMHTAFKQDSYEQVYPDAGRADVLFKSAIALETLDDNQQLAIAQFQREYRYRYAALCNEMEESVMSRRLASYQNNPNQRTKEWFRLEELGLAREELNRRQIDKLRIILSREQLAQLPSWDFQKYPPSRPWMRRGQ